MKAVLDYSSKPPVIRCMHCQDSLEVRLPETVDTCIKLMQDFDRKHARCWIDRQMRKGIHTEGHK